MLVSITVVVITATVAKNNQQVFNNIEYEKSYNQAETVLIEAVPALSDPNFDIAEVASIDFWDKIGADNCELSQTNEYYCRYTDASANRNTIVTVEETNRVEAYDLAARINTST
jgi:hypothetical protein